MEAGVPSRIAGERPGWLFGGAKKCATMPPTMVNVADNEVKDRLDELLTAAEGGQTVAITRNGKTVAQMAPAPAVANGEYDGDERARRLNAMLDSIDGESYQRNMENWLRRVEEFRKKWHNQGGSVSEETIDAIFREMRGR